MLVRAGRIGAWLSHRLLKRGEAVVAWTGAAGVLVLTLSLGASAWWTVHTNERSLREARAGHLRTIADLASRALEARLEAPEGLSAARTLVVDTALRERLSVCRIILPDGSVLADADPRAISAQTLPVNWPTSPGPGDPDPWRGAPPGADRVETPVYIAGRRPASLLIADSLPVRAWSRFEFQAGAGFIAASSLALMLLSYRALRDRTRALGAIREALAAADAGESGSAALSVAADLGPEAGAWNRLLAERDKLRDHLLGQKVAERVSSKRVRDGDLASACDALSQGMLLIDDRLGIRYLNGAAAVFLRVKREEIAGKDAAATIDDPGVLEAVRAIATGASRHRATIEVKRDADRGGGILRYTVRPVRREDAATALVVIEDVTQQRIADESRNSFVAQATHELRTPLTNIRLYVDQLLEGGDADPLSRAKGLNVINQESRRLERIVGDMLSVAEIEAGSLKLCRDDVRLETVFPEIEAEFQPQAAAKDIRLSFDLPPKLPVIQGDRDKIVQATHNLIANAIKYTPAGGAVEVRVGVEKSHIAVDIVDSGIGIRPEEQELIFEKFYRAKDRRLDGITGSGLGLALSREIARLHGGDITVRSEIDKGSTFSMTIPAQAAA